MRFFFDNCISPKIAEALHILEEPNHEICHLRAKFPDQGVKDPEWIHTLGVEGSWTIVSGDPNISKNPVNKEAWHQSGLTAFFFVGTYAQKAKWVQFSS